MAFFLGLTRVAEKAGLMRDLSRWVAPFLRRLFPDVPPDPPALSAMEPLDTLNPRRRTARLGMPVEALPTGFVHRLPGQHDPGQHGNHVLRFRGLFRGYGRPAHPPRAPVLAVHWVFGGSLLP